MRKDLKDIDQSIRNDVLAVQEEYADLFGMDPYEIGFFFWECIYEQIKYVFGNPHFVDRIMHDLILNVMGDDRIHEDMQTDPARRLIDELEEELTVDEALEDFGRMTKRVAVSGRIDLLDAMRKMLLRHEKAVKGIQKTLEKILSEPGYSELFREFLPECRYDPEHCSKTVSRVMRKVNRNLSAYRKMIRKAAEIAKTAMDIEIERGKSYVFE